MKKLSFNIFAHYKKKKFKKIKKYSFKIEKRKTIIKLPEKLDRVVKYFLIPKYASVSIIKKNGKILYNISEPKMTKKENELYDKIVAGLMEIIDVELSKLKTNALNYLKQKVDQVILELEINVPEKSYNKIMYYIYRNFIGLNEIEPLMHDPYIEDISCDGVGIPIYVVHKKYGNLKTNIVFETEERLRKFITKLAERTGRFISYADPLLDGALPDGSRVQATYSKDVTAKGPTFCIRKFRIYPFSPIELIENKTVSLDVMAYLWFAVENGGSILITGGTGTGKTSLLNSLSMFVHPSAKIVTVEDTREIQLTHENWLPAVTRSAFTEDLGEVTMFDLLKESFRQRPDYLIVGEVRGKEAYVLFQAMASGIAAMGTMHAGKTEDVLNRLKSPPISLPGSLLDTLDLIILMTQLKKGKKIVRKIDEIVEIEAVDPKTSAVRTSKVYNWIATNDTYQYKGSSWFLDEISRLKGFQSNEIQKEIELRKKILNYMLKNKIRNYADFTRTIEDFYINREKFLKKIS
ncbi:MAG: type II/IV secretion system ATPase subunit [Candidatus Aenigmarchaeota archaeon]|nr:type II/IV secretion system ATPase subunit [Candidatus Aenigmarchaeota archaeon]